MTDFRKRYGFTVVTSIGAYALMILAAVLLFDLSFIMHILSETGVKLSQFLLMMMMNCFCGMIDRRKAFSLISSRDH